jgi:hypothetical protein
MSFLLLLIKESIIMENKGYAICRTFGSKWVAIDVNRRGKDMSGSRTRPPTSQKIW